MVITFCDCTTWIQTAKYYLANIDISVTARRVAIQRTDTGSQPGEVRLENQAVEMEQGQDSARANKIASGQVGGRSRCLKAYPAAGGSQ